jgi:hypothetical protein
LGSLTEINLLLYCHLFLFNETSGNKKLAVFVHRRPSCLKTIYKVLALFPNLLKEEGGCEEQTYFILKQSKTAGLDGYHLLRPAVC